MLSGSSFRLDTPKSLAIRIAQRLREAITDGQFPLGSMIPEESLAASFGVSRTPVREALGQLQLQGLVVIRPQRGSYVFEPSEDDIASLCEFRCVLEPRAAELSYRNDREGTTRALRAAIEEMEQARLARDSARYGSADTALHEAFFDHCGNPYMQGAYATAAAKIAALRIYLSAPTDVLDTAGFKQHSDLLALFEAGDFANFEATMCMHVTGTRDNYTRVLKQRIAGAAEPGRTGIGAP